MNDPTSIENQIPLALRAAYMAMHRQTDAALIELGVTADQFVLLLALSQEKHLIQREIADRISSDPSTVRAMLVLLEKSGLVERREDPSDSRAKLVNLTPTGRQKIKELWAAGHSIRQQITHCMNGNEAETFVECLQRVATALQ